MDFEHVRIDDRPPCGRLAFCLTPDLTGNGRPDVVVGGLGRRGEIELLGKRIILRHLPMGERFYRWRESNVFWYENPGWKRHDVVSEPNLSVGGSCGDIDGDGRTEFVAGRNLGSELFWFDPGSDPRDRWATHLITDRFEKYHDTTIADVDDDGEDELVILSQHSEVVCYYDIPDDPRVSPWPDSHLHVLADAVDVEGLAVADLDDDGQHEIVAGPNVFDRNGSQETWERMSFGDDWRWTRVAVGDIDDDGRSEIVLAEGDRPYYGDRLGRLGIVDTRSWRIEVLDADLFCPHTVQLGDLTGDGRLDIVVGEMGLGRHETPHLWVYRNRGDRFDRTEIQCGIPTHEARVIDLDGDGHLDIVGKSYAPTAHVDAWIQTA